MKYFLNVFLLVMIFLKSLMGQELKVGMKAPDFTLPYATADTIYQKGLRLSDFFYKKPVLIAFYPADWSGGCTKQLCQFRDEFQLFQDFDVEILAISGDYVWSHHNWAKAQNYKFKLLSDHDHKVANLYNSYNKDTGYNKRTIFLLNKEGIITYIDMKYNPMDDKSYNNLKVAIQKLKK